MRFNHPIVGTNREDESEGWAVNCQDVLEVPRFRGGEIGVCGSQSQAESK